MGSSPDSRAITTPQRRLLPTASSSPARGTGEKRVACASVRECPPSADRPALRTRLARLGLFADIPNGVEHRILRCWIRSGCNLAIDLGAGLSAPPAGVVLAPALAPCRDRAAVALC